MSEQKTATGLIALLDRMLVWIALIFGGVTLAAMTCLSVWNVLIMRKALNAPIIGAEEIMVLMLITVVALSIPLGARTGAHIEIETADELAVTARGDKQRLAHLHDFGRRVMSMSS